jgi:ABC-type molybdate transport system ATPase subunit
MRRVAPGAVGFDEIIDLLGIEALLDRRPHTLSGGSASASRSDARCWPSRICC